MYPYLQVLVRTAGSIFLDGIFTVPNGNLLEINGTVFGLENI